MRRAVGLPTNPDDALAVAMRAYANDTPVNGAYRFFAEIPLKKPDIGRAKALLAEAAFPGGITQG